MRDQDFISYFVRFTESAPYVWSFKFKIPLIWVECRNFERAILIVCFQRIYFIQIPRFANLIYILLLTVVCETNYNNPVICNCYNNSGWWWNYTCANCTWLYSSKIALLGAIAVRCLYLIYQLPFLQTKAKTGYQWSRCRQGFHKRN